MFLSCRSASAQLTDGEPGLGTRLHLAFCQDCTRYLVQLRAVRAALGALRAGGVAEETKGRLGQQFRAWRRRARED